MVSLVVEQISPKDLARVRFLHHPHMKILLIFILSFILIEIVRYFLGFHSFFKSQKKKWIGFDFDGTIAHTVKGKFKPEHIGEPIPKMIFLLKQYINDGKEVKIFSARVSTNGTIPSIYNALLSRFYMNKWCIKHIGRKIDIVCQKDFLMVKLYDDLAIRVIKDTGEIVE